MGVVSGFVVDDQTGAPIANAQITVGGVATRARTDGSFDANAPAGRARVEVKSDGFLQTIREVAIGSVGLSLPFKLSRKEASQMVGSGGGDFRFREAVLTVPEGAFASNTPVSLTYVGRVRVAATASSPQFIDRDQIPRRVVATVDLDSSQPPSAPVRVRVPVPSDASMDTVRGFGLDAQGQWTAAIAPALVSGGIAEFSLSGNTRFGVAIDARRADGRRIGYLVAEAGEATMQAGDLLTGGNDIATASRAVALVDPQGSRIELGPATRARVEVPSGEMPAGVASRMSSFAGSAVLSAGSARVLVPAGLSGPGGLIKLSFQTPVTTLDVRGTGFSIATCETSSGFVDVLEVVEGTVEARFGDKTSAVGTGETATFCTSCPQGAAPVCQAGDASPPATDVQISDVGTPDTVVVRDVAPQPEVAVATDTMTTVDARSAPDAGATPDTATRVPDAAAMMVDAMAPPLDAPVPPADMAVLEPDAASPPPDVAAAQLVISPPSESYGTVEIGTASVTKDFTVTNIGDSATGPLSVQVAGAQFMLVSTDCRAPLPGKGSCVASVRYLPTIGGSHSGSLGVMATTGQSASATVSGFGAEPPRLEMMPQSQSFGSVAPGQSSAQINFTVKNAGGIETSLPMAVTEGVHHADFAITSNGCTVPLGAGVTCVVGVTFNAPTALGVKTATNLRVTADRGGTVTASLEGNASYVEVTPVVHDFGQQMAGSATLPTPFLFTIRNVGAGTAAPTIFISSGLSGTDWMHFNNVGTTCSANGLPGGQTCEVRINFAPRDAGFKNAVLTVRGHDPAGTPAFGEDESALLGTGF